MPCGKCATARNSKVTYLHTAADGSKKVFSTETEAKAAVARRGGSYKQQ